MPSNLGKRLDSWKEIAEYLGRDVRTAMRWERELGLPVHRLPGGQRSGVFAIADEIDEWLNERGNRVTQRDLETTSTSGVLRLPEEAPRIYMFFGIALLVVLALPLLLGRTSTPKKGELSFELPGSKFRFTETSKVILQGSMGMASVADLNNDGWEDIIVGGGPANNIAVLINHGGIFDSPKFYTGCNSSMGPALGDFDGDGNLDVALACYRAQEAQVWWGDGNGGLTAPVSLRTFGIESLRCVPGDFNGDGITDFVVDASGGGQLTLFTGHHDRSFTRTLLDGGANPQHPAVADIDGDGVLDIVLGCASAACHNVTLLRGLGDGRFKPAESIPGADIIWTVYVSDLTGDNIPDIFAGSINGESSFFAGIGKGKFLPAKVALHAASTDISSVFSSQGKNYILELQLYPAELRLLSFDAQRNVSVSSSAHLDGIPRAPIIGDFNHDGRQDIAVLSMERDSSYITVYVQR